MATVNPNPWANGAPACFIGFGPNGVCHYRTYMPAQQLEASMFVRNERDLTVIKQLGVLEEPMVIYSMPFADWQVAECAQIIQSGQRLVVDVDDWLPSILSGAKDDLVQPERFTQETIDLHLSVLKKATLVTCSTQFIKERCDEIGVEAIVCPNAIDPDRFNVRRFPRRKDKTIVGWSGSGGHMEAFEKIIVPAMNKVLRERDDVMFCIVGSPKPDINVVELLDEDVRPQAYAAGWAPIYQHAVLISQFHISLAPSLQNDFYRSKSDIRFLEAASGYSAVVAGGPTYGQTIFDGAERMGEEVGLLADCEDPDAWVHQIMSLLADPKKRDRMSRIARKYVTQNRTMEQSGPQWESAINRALEK